MVRVVKKDDGVFYLVKLGNPLVMNSKSLIIHTWNTLYQQYMRKIKLPPAQTPNPSLPLSRPKETIKQLSTFSLINQLDNKSEMDELDNTKSMHPPKMLKPKQEKIQDSTKRLSLPKHSKIEQDKPSSPRGLEKGTREDGIEDGTIQKSLIKEGSGTENALIKPVEAAPLLKKDSIKQCDPPPKEVNSQQGVLGCQLKQQKINQLRLSRYLGQINKNKEPLFDFKFNRKKKTHDVQPLEEVLSTRNVFKRNLEIHDREQPKRLFKGSVFNTHEERWSYIDRFNQECRALKERHEKEMMGKKEMEKVTVPHSTSFMEYYFESYQALRKRYRGYFNYEILKLASEEFQRIRRKREEGRDGEMSKQVKSYVSKFGQFIVPAREKVGLGDSKQRESKQGIHRKNQEPEREKEEKRGYQKEDEDQTKILPQMNKDKKEQEKLPKMQQNLQISEQIETDVDQQIEEEADNAPEQVQENKNDSENIDAGDKSEPHPKPKPPSK